MDTHTENMLNSILDKFRPVSVERINDFLTRKCIEHTCTKLDEISFKIEDLNWHLYIDENYFKIELAFTIDEESDNKINKLIAEKACLEVTKQIKVLKAHYISHEYTDEDQNNKLIKFHILIFAFESYCFNMYDFSYFFFTGLNIIIGGKNEYHKIYDELESKLPGTSIGFSHLDSENTYEKSQPTNRHRIGFD